MRVIIVAIIAVLAFALSAFAEEISGIGADFTQKINEPVRVGRIYPGSPAEKAGAEGTMPMPAPLCSAF